MQYFILTPNWDNNDLVEAIIMLQSDASSFFLKTVFFFLMGKILLSTRATSKITLFRVKVAEEDDIRLFLSTAKIFIIYNNPD